MSTLILTDLRVTNVKDAGGNNPSTPAEIQQGRVKAWFNLNGTGTIAARDSFGISSFTDNATGIYSANFATPRPSTGYSPSGLAGNSAGSGLYSIQGREISIAPTTSSYSVRVADNGVASDLAYVYLSIDGD